MPNEHKSYLWKAIDRWENEGGAPGGTEQTNILSSSLLSSSRGAKAEVTSLPHIERRFRSGVF